MSQKNISSLRRTVSGMSAATTLSLASSVATRPSTDSSHHHPRQEDDVQTVVPNSVKTVTNPAANAAPSVMEDEQSFLGFGDEDPLMFELKTIDPLTKYRYYTTPNVRSLGAGSEHGSASRYRDTAALMAIANAAIAAAKQQQQQQQLVTNSGPRKSLDENPELSELIAIRPTTTDTISSTDSAEQARQQQLLLKRPFTVDAHEFRAAAHNALASGAVPCRQHDEQLAILSGGKLQRSLPHRPTALSPSASAFNLSQGGSPSSSSSPTAAQLSEDTVIQHHYIRKALKNTNGSSQQIAEVHGRTRWLLVHLWNELGIPKIEQEKFNLELQANAENTDTYARIFEEIGELTELRKYHFATIEKIVTREAYRKRLEDLMHKFQPKENSRAQRHIQRDIINVILAMRRATVDAVQCIVQWRKRIAPPPRPFVWEGINYMLKMQDDLEFLEGSELAQCLNCEVRRNPCLLPGHRTMTEDERILATKHGIAASMLVSTLALGQPGATTLATSRSQHLTHRNTARSNAAMLSQSMLGPTLSITTSREENRGPVVASRMLPAVSNKPNTAISASVSFASYGSISRDHSPDGSFEGSGSHKIPNIPLPTMGSGSALQQRTAGLSTRRSQQATTRLSAEFRPGSFTSESMSMSFSPPSDRNSAMMLSQSRTSSRGGGGGGSFSISARTISRSKSTVRAHGSAESFSMSHLLPSHRSAIEETSRSMEDLTQAKLTKLRRHICNQRVPFAKTPDDVPQTYVCYRKTNPTPPPDVHSFKSYVLLRPNTNIDMKPMHLHKKRGKSVLTNLRGSRASTNSPFGGFPTSSSTLSLPQLLHPSASGVSSGFQSLSQVGTRTPSMAVPTPTASIPSTPNPGGITPSVKNVRSRPSTTTVSGDARPTSWKTPKPSEMMSDEFVRCGASTKYIYPASVVRLNAENANIKDRVQTTSTVMERLLSPKTPKTYPEKTVRHVKEPGAQVRHLIEHALKIRAAGRSKIPPVFETMSKVKTEEYNSISSENTIILQREARLSQLLECERIIFAENQFVIECQKQQQMKDEVSPNVHSDIHIDEPSPSSARAVAPIPRVVSDVVDPASPAFRPPEATEELRLSFFYQFRDLLVEGQKIGPPSSSGDSQDDAEDGGFLTTEEEEYEDEDDFDDPDLALYLPPLTATL